MKGSSDILSNLALHYESQFRCRQPKVSVFFSNHRLFFFSSASSRLDSYYGLSFLENRLFCLFMIHMIMTTYRDILLTWFGFPSGFYTGLDGVFPCIFSGHMCHLPLTPWFPMAELSELLSSCIFFHFWSALHSGRSRLKKASRSLSF